MRLTWIVPATAMVAVGLCASGCKSDATAPHLSLSQAEVTQWLSELGSLPIGYALVAGPVDLSASCPSGGTARQVGSVIGTTNQTWSVTTTFNACKTTSFTTDGSFLMTGSQVLSSSSYSYRDSGTVMLTASGGRSGSCVIDFSYASNGTSSTKTGTICGVDASVVVPGV